MENKIYGVLDFENEFYFSGDVLGSCIETKLKNIKIKYFSKYFVHYHV